MPGGCTPWPWRPRSIQGAILFASPRADRRFPRPATRRPRALGCRPPGPPESCVAAESGQCRSRTCWPPCSNILYEEEKDGRSRSPTLFRCRHHLSGPLSFLFRLFGSSFHAPRPQPLHQRLDRIHGQPPLIVELRAFSFGRHRCKVACLVACDARQVLPRYGSGRVLVLQPLLHLGPVLQGYHLPIRQLSLNDFA